LKRQDTLDFARYANAVPAAGVEFFYASRDFPAIFGKDQEDNFAPLILLSLREKGHPLGRTWDNVYMPMFVRRYPFAMSSEGSIIIDKQAPHLREDEGDRLFTEEGENTEVLDTIVRFLGYVDKTIKQTQEFSNACAEKELFKPFDTPVQVEEGKPVTLSSFYIIDEKKAGELSDEEVAQWFHKGWLPWLYAHLHSLTALHRLVRREREANAAANESA
jgi:hypothetical protein